MRIMQRVSSTLGDQRFTFSALVFATGLVLTLQNPMARDSATDLFSRVDLSNLSQVFEMRPQTPPPAMEGDQFMTDEGEEIQPLVTTERSYDRDSDPRSIPGR
jgi:hypothetical protein